MGIRKPSIKERIKAITSYKKRKTIILISGLVLVLIIAAVFGTGAISRISSKSDAPSSAVSGISSSTGETSITTTAAPTSIVGDTTETSAQPGELTMDDLKIGKLFIGESLDNIQKDFGEPKAKTIVHGIGDPQWEYPDLGLTIGGGPAWTIRSYKDIGSTPRGIHIGSTEREVRKAYPTAKEVGPDNATLNSNNSNGSTQSDFTLQAYSPKIGPHNVSHFSIAFFISKGKVIGIDMYKNPGQ